MLLLLGGDEKHIIYLYLFLEQDGFFGGMQTIEYIWREELDISISNCVDRGNKWHFCRFWILDARHILHAFNINKFNQNMIKLNKGMNQ